jgi:hypothetical protein
LVAPGGVGYRRGNTLKDHRLSHSPGLGLVDRYQKRQVQKTSCVLGMLMRGEVARMNEFVAEPWVALRIEPVTGSA